ncbi:MAG: YvrJ family protein [Chloroflexi bacterium]|nr:YvrJ family protein [Chloroflexota bacterium]
MDVDTITKLISNVGFPIFVAVYLLWRMEGVINKMTDAIDAINITIQKCAGPKSGVQ